MTTYSKEFKEEAVKLVEEIGVNKTSKHLSIPASTLSGWVKKSREYKENAFIGSGRSRQNSNYTQRELELMAKNKELERANEILKEALGFFAKSQKK